MPNEIDELFARLEEDPTSATKDDIDRVITMYRQARANQAAGVRPKKDTGPKVKIDLEELGLKSMPKTTSAFRRRF